MAAAIVPLRILYVLDKSGFGGVQSIAGSMLEHGVPGVEITYYFLRNINQEYGIADLKQANVIYAKSRRKYNFSSFVELCRVISGKKIDIVHLNGNKSAVYGYLIKKLLPNLKIINHDHSSEFDYGGWFSRFIKFFAPQIDRFLCISERRKRFLVDVCAVDPAKIIVLNNFVDERRFVRQERTSAPEERKAFIIGFVGRLSRIKGCDVLVRALPLIVDDIPNLEVHIVGNGPERSSLGALAHELGVDQKISFLGFVSNPAAAYANFDLMVIPSRAEEGPICLYEAWMMGIPVVASDAPVINERIRDRDNGLLFVSGDPRSLAKKIMEVFADKELQERLRTGGAQEVGQLTATKYCEKLVEIYKSLQ